MNRYLSFPLVITLVGFSIAYMSRSSFGEPVVSPSTFAIAVNAAHKPNAPNVQPMSFEDVQVQVLDGWPTVGVNHFASRRMIIEPLYATMGQLAQVDANGKPDPNAKAYFCSLTVNAHPLTEKGQAFVKSQNGIHGRTNSGHFAIHVDRYTKEMNVFADGKWQDYKTWQKIAIPKYSELTGWNQDAPKAKQRGGIEGSLKSNDLLKLIDSATDQPPNG